MQGFGVQEPSLPRSSTGASWMWCAKKKNLQKNKKRKDFFLTGTTFASVALTACLVMNHCALTLWLCIMCKVQVHRAVIQSVLCSHSTWLSQTDSKGPYMHLDFTFLFYYLKGLKLWHVFFFFFLLIQVFGFYFQVSHKLSNHHSGCIQLLY